MRAPKGSLRQRRRQNESYTQTSQPTIITTFKSLDMFPKIDSPNEKESRVRTESGGCISIIGLVIIAWLVLSETFYFIFPFRTEHLIIDKMYDSKLNIKFDITFHSIPCTSLGVDVMDVTGEQQVHVNQDIHKQRLDLNGKTLSESVKITNHNDHAILFGGMFQFMKMDTAQEGCRVNGDLHIQKVSGNFHLALGQAHEIRGKHIHQFVLSDIPKFNCSHTIHHMSFGDYFPSQSMPLNGMQHVISKVGGGVFTYNIRIIPTEYISPFGYRTPSNSFNFQYKYRHIDPVSGPGQRMTAALPGIFFVYKINPYMLQISEKRSSFTKFIVNLCAIAGGIFAIAKLLDSITFNLIYNFTKDIKNKFVLPKYHGSNI